MFKILKRNFGYIFILFLAIVPLIMWYFMSPLGVRFSSQSTAFRSLGQATGLLGMSLLSLNFILAARFKFMDRAFSGLNIVYIKHSLIGAVSFCLLLFHPIFLVVQYFLISLKSSLLFLFSFSDWSINYGEIALLVFILLMAITFYFHFKYQNWKNTHKFLGIVLLLGSLHMFLVTSDISNNDVLKYYMLVLAILGGVSYFYRTIFGIYKKNEYQYKLESVVRVNDDVVELRLLPFSRKIKYKAGQFVFVRFNPTTQSGNGVLAESHPFSVTSHPDDKYLILTIKTLGDYTSMVYLLKPGAVCSIEGPFGAFSYKNSASMKQVWVAGGIGVTPFLSMARQINFDKMSKDYQIDLFYCIKNKDEAVYWEEFSEISIQNPNFKFHQFYSDTEGRVSAEYILKNLSDSLGIEIFLCGPAGFMQSLRNQFVKLGFNNSKIYSEEFSLSI
ncbi:MAG: ferric reductase-like transmembrane domain-containing protein [bacterium]